MKEATISIANPTLSQRATPRLRDRLARRALLARLAHIEYGSITLLENGASWHFGATAEHSELACTVSVHNTRCYTDIVLGGSVGAGEAYMQGDWSCDNLTSLVRILLRNRKVLDGMDESLSRLAAPLHHLAHWLRRNTHAGSRRNIRAHYDLGNEMFSLFLDDTMMYSCALFEHPDATLREASVAKLDRICRKLELSARDHVLEIGTGWGGFAIHAAKHYGCRVTTTTISREQYTLARQRIAAAGLADQIEVLCEDYRTLRGAYDKLVSIEMIEAVGYDYLGTYFRQCSELLKPDGMMLLQAITIADWRYEAAKRAVDFIQRYIFPGGALPSVSAMAGAIAEASDMRVFHLEDIGPHYARTLRLWRERFFVNLDKVKALGYPDAFVRMWEFYLCYCEGGFHERATGTVQMLLTKPMCRRAPVLART